MGPTTPFASSEALAAMLGMAGVGVSLCGQPMHASDAESARLEDRQFVPRLVIDGDEALSRIRAYAFRTDRALADVVADLRTHRLQLPDDRAPLTESG